MSSRVSRWIRVIAIAMFSVSIVFALLADPANMGATAVDYGWRVALGLVIYLVLTIGIDFIFKLIARRQAAREEQDG